MNNFTREEYEYIWGGTGFTLLFQSLLLHGLAKYPFADQFCISQGNEMKVFRLKSSTKECIEYGKKQLGSKDNLVKLCESLDGQADLLLGIKPVASSWDTFSEYSFSFLKDYSVLDPDFSDVVLGDEHNKELLEYVGTYKNNFREKLNQIFFTNDSVLKKLLENISETYKVSEDVLNNTSVEDMHAILRKSKIAPQRNKDYVIWVKNGAVGYSFDQSAIGTLGDSFVQEKEYPHAVLRGKSVSVKGVYAGRIKKVVLDYTKLDQVLKEVNDSEGGFILLSDHTIPELLPIMKKSLAIITQMGGILSHAAITARELKMPCLVGVEHSMDILKMGDMVEVNADNGTVKIL